ncbi:MAG: hypothetical protein RRA15_08595 [bacterium]|nr:hypothetical protein [bacterium]MDT8366539.1 hypothetical protein [bacterium]
MNREQRKEAFAKSGMLTFKSIFVTGMKGIKGIKTGNGEKHSKFNSSFHVPYSIFTSIPFIPFIPEKEFFCCTSALL